MPSPSDFTPHVGAAFRFGSLELRLTEVETKQAAGEAAFTLIFAGPRSPVLPEGSHPVQVPYGPGQVLYIMPIHTTAADRQDYQVVFN